MPVYRVRAVTFDAGSTLIHWWAYTPHRLGRLYRRAGIEITDDESCEATRACMRYRQQVAEPTDHAGRARWWREYNAVGLRATGVTGDVEVLCDRIHDTVRGLPAEFVPDPDVPAVLDALRTRGVVLGVVSNWEGDLRQRLEAMGIAHYFDFIGDSAVLGVSKPNPEIYLIACRALGVAPGECLHIGDRPESDVEVARAVGAAPVLYDPLGWFDSDCATVRRLMDVLPLVG